eukprot:scaffold16843_cov51-Cyclotella_meneghiniana.AAC.6
MGAAVQSIFLLIDCKAADQTTIPGRKNIPAIEITTHAQQADSSFLCTQDVTHAGIYEDGSIDKSVTNAITIEIERLRALSLASKVEGQFQRTEYERWAFESCTTDHRAKSVVSEYQSRFQNLDKHYAPDVVGDGNGRITGPFESAQNQFHCGQVIPLCAGAFGEVNRDFTRLNKVLARGVSASEEGLSISISPLVITDRKEVLSYNT